MEFTQFTERLKTIKLLKDRIDIISTKITEAFSDDIVYNRIYVETFDKIVDKMAKDLTDEISYQHNVKLDFVESCMDYLIYEVDFCSDKRKFSVNNIEYDYTIYNGFLDMIEGNLEELADNFEKPKVEI